MVVGRSFRCGGGCIIQMCCVYTFKGGGCEWVIQRGCESGSFKEVVRVGHSNVFHSKWLLFVCVV